MLKVSQEALDILFHKYPESRHYFESLLTSAVVVEDASTNTLDSFFATDQADRGSVVDKAEQVAESIRNPSISENEFFTLFEKRKSLVERDAEVKGRQLCNNWSRDKLSLIEVIDANFKEYGEIYEKAHALRLKFENEKLAWTSSILGSMNHQFRTMKSFDRSAQSQFVTPERGVPFEYSANHDSPTSFQLNVYDDGEEAPIQVGSKRKLASVESAGEWQARKISKKFSMPAVIGTPLSSRTPVSAKAGDDGGNERDDRMQEATDREGVTALAGEFAASVNDYGGPSVVEDARKPSGAADHEELFLASQQQGPQIVGDDDGAVAVAENLVGPADANVRNSAAVAPVDFVIVANEPFSEAPVDGSGLLTGSAHVTVGTDEVEVVPPMFAVVEDDSVAVITPEDPTDNYAAIAGAPEAAAGLEMAADFAALPAEAGDDSAAALAEASDDAVAAASVATVVFEVGGVLEDVLSRICDQEDSVREILEELLRWVSIGKAGEGEEGRGDPVAEEEYGAVDDGVPIPQEDTEVVGEEQMIPDGECCDESCAVDETAVPDVYSLL